MRPINNRISDDAGDKLDELVRKFESQRVTFETLIRDGFEKYIPKEKKMNTRRFVEHSQLIEGGEYTDEELVACRIVGGVNLFRTGLYEGISQLRADAPPGWRVASSDGSTHSYDPPVPERQDAITEPILLGFIHVHHGDPHFPIWIFKIKS